MTNEEKKKINDKKYIRKNIIVALIGVMIFAILICTTVTKAADYSGSLTLYKTDFNRTSSSVVYTFSNSGSYVVEPVAGANNLIVHMYVIIQSTASTINVRCNNSNLHIYRLDKITSNTNGYNVYKGEGTNELTKIDITLAKESTYTDQQIDTFWITYTDADDASIENRILFRCDFLNRPKYISQLTSVADEMVYLMADGGEIYYEPDIYLDNAGRVLIIRGQVAINGGVSQYIYSVNGVRQGDVANNTPQASLTYDFVLDVHNSGYDITNYNRNGNFEIGIVLLPFDGYTVNVKLSAVDTSGAIYDICKFVNVHVYAAETETDSETEPDSDVETETDNPVDDTNLAYEQGFQDALSQMAKTPLFNATVNGTIVIEDQDGATSISKIQYKISILTNKGGFALSSIKPLIDIVQENNPNSTVYLSELSITFDRQVVFTNDLVIFGTQSPILAINDTTNSEGYVSYYNPTITFKGKFDNGIYKDFDAFYFKYAPLDNIYGSESPFVYAMRISETDWLGQLYKISFTDMIIDTNSQFLNSVIYIPYEAYIKLADAEAFGNINGWERGFEQGKQSPSNISYQKGFEAGKLQINNDEYTRGYWDGVEAGDSLRNVILAPFDGISGVFHNMLNVNILGFQLDDIIGAILLMLMVIWIGKKVI